MTAVDTGLFLLRLVVGVLLICHAMQKATGAFGGDGFASMAALFDRLGFRPGRMTVTIAIAAELGGGVLLVLGLFTPLAAAALAGTLIVAASVHWPNGVWGSKGGYELPGALAAAAVALALIGPGRFALDHAMDIYPAEWVRWSAAAVGIVAGLGFVAAKPLMMRLGSSEAGP
ncbi:DoxX family membrane protein [Cumulibacter soli]|uniref:DoxX family membrane protein n=1 Tax=Cumulibacter soli TaxID=2546344 RepID=UPI0010672D9F|nr:DoxX family membrane protein [Cumulibacter soli]